MKWSWNGWFLVDCCWDNTVGGKWSLNNWFVEKQLWGDIFCEEWSWNNWFCEEYCCCSEFDGKWSCNHCFLEQNWWNDDSCRRWSWNDMFFWRIIWIMMVQEGIQLYSWFQWWVIVLAIVVCLYVGRAMQWVAECDIFFSMCDGI